MITRASGPHIRSERSLPSTDEVAAKFKDRGVLFLAVNVWNPKKEFSAWLPKRKQLGSQQFSSDPSARRPMGRPASITSPAIRRNVIDRKGHVVTNIGGYDDDDTELLKSIKTALSEG